MSDFSKRNGLVKFDEGEKGKCNGYKDKVKELLVGMITYIMYVEIDENYGAYNNLFVVGSLISCHLDEVFKIYFLKLILCN